MSQEGKGNMKLQVQLMDDRLKIVEASVNERLKIVEAAVKSMAAELKELGTRVEEGLKEASRESKETASTAKVSETVCVDKIGVLGKTVEELTSSVTAVELAVNEVREQWPTPNEWKTAVNARNCKKMTKAATVKKMSFAEKWKNKSAETVVVLGDSLVRGVGQHLQRDSHMFSFNSISGARIETVKEEVEKLDNKDDRHLVLVVGTNNIKSEGSEIIRARYEQLVSKCKNIRNRAVTLVGIPKRYDLNDYLESRRLGVNTYLKEICQSNKIEYLEYDPVRARMLRDGLHLNAVGQDEMARKIFTHCKAFLV
jgi:lysophospholipase L1-like esterase